MKRKIIFLIIGLALILSACKSKDGDGEPKSILPERSYPQYEYSMVMTRCSRSETEMMCKNFGEDDAVSLNNMLSAKGLEGWELVNVLTVSEKKGPVHTFIFKRMP
jgi:protein involved in sex pheromone biosynthesis